MVEGSCGKRGMVASELRTEPCACMQVGLPGASRYRGKGMKREVLAFVSDERAQARNLGGTAKQPFALKRGKAAFFGRRPKV